MDNISKAYTEAKTLDGKKISLSVCIEADSNSFTENERREIISEFGVIAQLLLAKLEGAVGYPKRHTSLITENGNAIKEHFGLDCSTAYTVFDSKDLAREFVALSFYKIDTPIQIVIDYDPDFPCAVLRKKDISTR